MKLPIRDFRESLFESLYWQHLQVRNKGKTSKYHTPDVLFRVNNQGFYGDAEVRLAHLFYLQGQGKSMIPLEYEVNR